MLGGFNVHTIALEVPTSMISNGSTVIGGYASTSRSRLTVRAGEDRDLGGQVQVQRLANPLVNEVIIGTQDKDRWNATEPEDESRFLDYYLKPRFALALQLVFGVNTGCFTVLAADCKPSRRRRAASTWQRSTAPTSSGRCSSTAPTTGGCPSSFGSTCACRRPRSRTSRACPDCSAATPPPGRTGAGPTTT